ncbi:MAG: transcription antitermination factor NusB [Chthoniobacteraceae bacterium]
MGKRRDGREAAVQYLFQCDAHSASPGKLEGDFWELRPSTQNVRDFGEAIIKGVLANKAEIDERIQKYTVNYELHRIAGVDRNILRVAIYEMLFCNDVPPIVAINEAIEIAKRYGAEESGRFVNGILDRVKHELTRPSRTTN